MLLNESLELFEGVFDVMETHFNNCKQSLAVKLPC